jgi:hypothetical protein
LPTNNKTTHNPNISKRVFISGLSLSKYDTKITYLFLDPCPLNNSLATVAKKQATQTQNFLLLKTGYLQPVLPLHNK